MNEQKATGWLIVISVLLLLWWLLTNGLSFLHGGTVTTSVQSGIVGGQQNQPTVTTSPCGSC